MRVRILKQGKTAMQSGRGGTSEWRIEPELESPRRPEPLMGWTSAGDTLNQIRLRFQSREDAVAFAERRGWSYVVEETHDRHIPPRSYADKFRRDRPKSW